SAVLKLSGDLGLTIHEHAMNVDALAERGPGLGGQLDLAQGPSRRAHSVSVDLRQDRRHPGFGRSSLQFDSRHGHVEGVPECQVANRRGPACRDLTSLARNLKIELCLATKLRLSDDGADRGKRELAACVRVERTART